MIAFDALPTTHLCFEDCTWTGSACVARVSWRRTGRLVEQYFVYFWAKVTILGAPGKHEHCGFTGCILEKHIIYIIFTTKFWSKREMTKMEIHFWPLDLSPPKVIDVSCGSHRASTCNDCPQGHGGGWCHGPLESQTSSETKSGWLWRPEARWKSKPWKWILDTR